MKKTLTLILASFVFVGPASALITNSAHDLSSTSTYYATAANAETDEICVFCHTPHAAAASAYAPLWNRGASTYTVADAYGNPSGTMQGIATFTTANATDAPLCLSCHDGSNMTIALNNAPNAFAPTNTDPQDPSGAYAAASGGAGSVSGFKDLIETVTTQELSNDHPIGMDYDASEAGGGMVAIGSVTVPLFGVANDMVWCSSCHDVHNGGPATADSLLHIDNAGSLLCLNCHAK